MFLSDLLNVPYVARNINPNDISELEQIKKKLVNPDRPILCLGKEEKKLISLGKNGDVKTIFDLTNGISNVITNIQTKAPTTFDMELVGGKYNNGAIELTGGLKTYIKLKDYKNVTVIPVDVKGVRIYSEGNIITIIPNEVQSTTVKTIKFKLEEKNKLPSGVITLNLKITPLSFTTDMQIVNDDFVNHYDYVNNFNF